MSFFFSKQARKPAKPAGKPPLGAPRNARASVAALRRLGCAACPLNKADVQSPKMLPTLARSTQVYFLAEAPGCIDGDSLIDTAFRDKSIYPQGIPIRDLVGKKDFYVYSYDTNNEKISLGRVNRVWRTGKKKVFRVHYTWTGHNGVKWIGTLIVTANHQFLLRNTKLHKKDPYKGLSSSARYLSINEGLKVGHSIQPLKRVVTNGRALITSAGGRLINEASLLASFKFMGKPPQTHHIDENKLNDTWENLASMTVAEHARYHTSKNNPMQNPIHRAAHKAAMQNEGYREGQRQNALTRWRGNHKITKIELVGVRDVYDMEVDGFHNFAVNGIFVHNSHEDQTSGKPLTGPSGSLLRQCIPSGFVAECSFDNACNCRPPGNRTPTWQEIECCQPRRVKFIEQAKPKLIVGLGAIPLHAILGSGDLAGMRGRLFAVKIGNHECWFMPTYHPSFILRTAYDKRKPLNSKLGHCFRMDINKACEMAHTLQKPAIESEHDLRSGVQCFDGSDPSHYGKLCALLDHAGQADTIAVDIETKGLRPFSDGAAIMSIAISTAELNFSFAVAHPNRAWAIQQIRELNTLCSRLFGSNGPIKVAHNAPFELEWFIWLFGRSIVDHAGWECTQMQAHFLDERRGKQGHGDDDRRAPYQSLDFLVKQHFGIKYKSLFKLNKKDMSKSDLGEMLIYNALDTKFTLKLYHTQTKLLKERGLHDAYLEALPRQTSVALMQTLGVLVDQAEVKRNQKKLGEEIATIEAEIDALPVVREYKADHREVNFAAGPDTLNIFRDYLKRSEILVADKYSVDKNVLDRIDHPLAELVLDLRNRTKLKTTYVDGLELGKGGLAYPDGKLHCNFNTTFAETGRTSSDDPNMQNFPQRRDAWIRKQIIAPKGHLLVAFDYGQLEGCTAAMCSKDKVLVKALWEDYDIHQEWAEKYTAKYPAAGPPDRSRIKNKLVFPAIFGAQNKSIAGYLGAPEEIIEDLMDEFWETFDGLAEWQDQLMQHYYKHGWVASPTGRRHHYPLTRNQAINHPVQSFACDIVCHAMNELSCMAVETNQWHLHPVLNIHDDLTFVIPDNDNMLEEAITTIYKIMLSPPYKEVNVPLSVKVSIGPAWYGMQEIGKFWSHKDL